MNVNTLIYIGLFLGIYNNLLGQNLVLNPSFEEGGQCDGSTEILDTVSTWKRVAGKPKFLNPDCPLSKDSKTFVQGRQMPSAHTGDAYVGLGIDVEGEYIQGTLKDTLKKDKIYVVKLRFRLPTRFCNEPLDEIGVVLSERPFEHTKDYRKIDTTSLKLKNNDKTALEAKYRWEEVMIKYTAQGNEKYITIGNFSDNNRANFARREGKVCTYLYIDDVSVEEFKEITLKKYNKGQNLTEGDRLELKNVDFVPGLAVLQDTSNATLTALAATLIEKPEISIEISGHTDNTSDAAISKKFSEDRAQAIADLLMQKGVPSKQLKVVGKGSSMNIATNDSDSGREKNNRIEIKVTIEGG